MARNPKANGSAGGTGRKVLVVLALAVFLFAAVKLMGIHQEYKAGRDEYAQLEEFTDRGDGKDTAASASAEREAEPAPDLTASESEKASSEPSEASSEPVKAPFEPEEASSETVEATSEPVKATSEPVKAKPELVEANSEPVEVASEPAKAASEPVEAEPEPVEAEPESAEAMPEPQTLDSGVMETPIDFAGLKEINSDIIGWIEMEAIDAYYPIMQAEDNMYYLYRTFRKVNNIDGSLFADYRNDPEFSDRNTVIYGHNMKDGSMFGNLKKYLERTVEVDGVEKLGAYDVSPYFWIYTPDYIYKYEIYSVARVNERSEDYQRVFETEEDYQKFIDRTVGESLIPTKATLSLEDTVVTLSTCTSAHEQRLIVQGKRIETYRAVPRADGYKSLEN